MSDTAPLLRQRLDKWLWHARMARTRTLAAKLVSEGHVRLHGRRMTDPSRKVRAGDILTLALAHAAIVVEVTDFADRRGSAPEARLLYRLLSPPDAPGPPDDGRADDLPDSEPMREADTGGDDETLAPDDDCR